MERASCATLFSFLRQPTRLDRLLRPPLQPSPLRPRRSAARRTFPPGSPRRESPGGEGTETGGIDSVEKEAQSQTHIYVKRRCCLDINLVLFLFLSVFVALVAADAVVLRLVQLGVVVGIDDSPATAEAATMQLLNEQQLDCKVLQFIIFD